MAVDVTLATMSAKAQLAAFRARTLSPVEVLDAQIAVSERVDPTLNAFTATFFDDARAAARASEIRYGQTDGQAGPLDGLSCVIKDEIKVAGQPWTAASLLYADRVADETDVIAERLIAAGAIVHARTATPEFCILGTTQSRLHGVTRNPFGPSLTSGGSSGGTGSALAAGMTTLGTGTDIGGSIRIPASCCGIVGLKASYGRIPETAVFNLDFYSHSGPMTRSVADCALMFNQVAGPSTRDIASLRDRVILPDTFPSVAGNRIAYSFDLGHFEVDEDVRANMQVALDALTAQGVEVEEVAFPWDDRCDRAAMDYLNFLWGQHMARVPKGDHDELTDYARAMIAACAATTGDDYLRSLEVAHEVYAAFAPTLERFDAFICPTTAIPAVAADHNSWDAPFEINGRSVDPEYGWVLTHPFNMLSRLPVLSIPSGLSRDGVPTGVQIVGKSYDEASAFRIAAAVDDAIGYTAPDLEAVQAWQGEPT
ncbi:MAG: amidase [Pseudomonadota bacterium]